MLRMVPGALVFLLALSSPVWAQSYQHSSDGLVDVHVKKVVEAGQHVSFDVCARLTRQENVGQFEVRLNFWGTSGGILAQASSFLRPQVAAPACQRIPLPQGAWTLGRWEIGRLRFQRDQVSQPFASLTRAD